ncbi:MAG: alpha-N-acetylglucosaminidase C-terminal domain-containing protein [Alistipes sp.]|nr:alpha-N-acetylglucosaminidase C-terminal domain-containing protein [Alistipes sp.]
MKRLLTFALATLLSVAGAAAQDYISAARDVISRAVGQMPENIDLSLCRPSAEGHHRYELSTDGGRLRIAGDNGVAICKGFYDYIVDNGYGVVTWTGSRIELPESFPQMEPIVVEAPFGLHIYMNVCTMGYTAPFWDRQRWQQEIDYMALHGFDMPLSPTAGEAIFARVWRDMGLSDSQIDEYFTGPAHMPWLRMGNMSQMDGGMSRKWHDEQVELQHFIKDQMDALGMTPVYQGFAGFVPKAMKEHYPSIDLTETYWAGGLKNYMLSPIDPLFEEIQRRYIAEWEREFGKCRYYLIDSFNEMDIPFGEKGSPERAAALREYGEKIYSSLMAADADAVWVVQGWIFGYQRDLWDADSARALFSGVPDDKVIIIDLAVDFNQYVWCSQKNWDYLDGFFGKQWIYSTVPNFGGRSATIGGLQFYADGHREAMSSANRGNIVGYGTSPEGVENNEIVYEIISDAGWRPEGVDLREKLQRYSAARYGLHSEHVDRFWEGMLGSAYAASSNNARFRWQMEPFSQRGSTLALNADYFRAIESLLAATELDGNPLYVADAKYYTAMYFAGIAQHLLEAIRLADIDGRDTSALEEEFIAALDNIDRVLADHPLYTMERWQRQAAAAATCQAEREEFVREARRIVTTWGGPSLADYSCRVWSGLVRDFYIPRWRNYFDHMHRGESYDARAFDDKFIERLDLSPAPRAVDLTECRRMVESYAGRDKLSPLGSTVATVTPYDFKKTGSNSIAFTIPNTTFADVKGVRIVMHRGSGSAVVESVKFRADKIDRSTARPAARLDAGHNVVEVIFDGKIETPTTPREVSGTIKLKGDRSEEIYATVELIM